MQQDYEEENHPHKRIKKSTSGTELEKVADCCFPSPDGTFPVFGCTFIDFFLKKLNQQARDVDRKKKATVKETACIEIFKIFYNTISFDENRQRHILNAIVERDCLELLIKNFSTDSMLLFVQCFVTERNDTASYSNDLQTLAEHIVNKRSEPRMFCEYLLCCFEYNMDLISKRMDWLIILSQNAHFKSQRSFDFVKSIVSKINIVAVSKEWAIVFKNLFRTGNSTMLHFVAQCLCLKIGTKNIDNNDDTELLNVCVDFLKPLRSSAVAFVCEVSCKIFYTDVYSSCLHDSPSSLRDALFYQNLLADLLQDDHALKESCFLEWLLNINMEKLVNVLRPRKNKSGMFDVVPRMCRNIFNSFWIEDDDDHTPSNEKTSCIHYFYKKTGGGKSHAFIDARMIPWNKFSKEECSKIANTMALFGLPTKSKLFIDYLSDVRFAELRPDIVVHWLNLTRLEHDLTAQKETVRSLREHDGERPVGISPMRNFFDVFVEKNSKLWSCFSREKMSMLNDSLLSSFWYEPDKLPLSLFFFDAYAIYSGVFARKNALVCVDDGSICCTGNTTTTLDSTTHETFEKYSTLFLLKFTLTMFLKNHNLNIQNIKRMPLFQHLDVDTKFEIESNIAYAYGYITDASLFNLSKSKKTHRIEFVSSDCKAARVLIDVDVPNSFVNCSIIERLAEVINKILPPNSHVDINDREERDPRTVLSVNYTFDSQVFRTRYTIDRLVNEYTGVLREIKDMTEFQAFLWFFHAVPVYYLFTYFDHHKNDTAHFLEKKKDTPRNISSVFFYGGEGESCNNLIGELKLIKAEYVQEYTFDVCEYWKRVSANDADDCSSFIIPFTRGVVFYIDTKKKLQSVFNTSRAMDVVIYDKKKHRVDTQFDKETSCLLSEYAKNNVNVLFCGYCLANCDIILPLSPPTISLFRKGRLEKQLLTKNFEKVKQFLKQAVRSRREHDGDLPAGISPVVCF